MANINMKIMNDRFYKLMTSHYKELDPKIYYLAELLFSWYIQKEHFGELLSRRSFSISLWRSLEDDCNLDIVEALILDNVFEKAIIEVTTYSWDCLAPTENTWHVELNSEKMNSPEYEEIYKKIWNNNGNKCLYFKINFNETVEVIQKYHKIWTLDQNDKTWKYFKSSVQISNVVKELYRQYDLYWVRSFILNNSDFPKIELANTLLFILLELWIIEIDFDYQFFREDRDRLPDDYKVKVIKDIRDTILFTKILEWKYSFNISLLTFIDKINTLEDLANKKLLKEEKIIELENQLNNNDFSFIQDDIFKTELEVLKSRKKPTTWKPRVKPWEPTIRCLWDIWLILKEWKRILSEYQEKYENTSTITNTITEKNHEMINERGHNSSVAQIVPLRNTDEENNDLIIESWVDYLISYNHERIELTQQEMIVMNKFYKSKTDIVDLDTTSLPRNKSAFEQMLKRLRKKIIIWWLKIDKQKGTKKDYGLFKLDTE